MYGLEKQPSSLSEYQEALFHLLRVKAACLKLLHTIWQRIAIRMNADTAGSAVVVSSVSVVLKSSIIKRSQAVLFAITVVLTVTANASACTVEPEITIPPLDTEAVLGETAIFTCRAHASLAMFWTVNGEHLTHTDSIIELLPTAVLDESICLMEGRLNIRAVPSMDNATIVCFAISSSDLPSATSSPVKLSVSGTAAVSKDSVKLVLEPDELVITSQSVESLVALSYQNLIRLEWNEPFTSDDPFSMKYNVTLANNKDQYHALFDAKLNTTNTILPTQIMANCCNYTIQITAVTQSYNANTTVIEVECFGFPIRLPNFQVSVEVLQENLLTTFQVEIPDSDCVNQRIDNMTIVIEDLSASSETEIFGPIGTDSLQGAVLQYSIKDLDRNCHFEAAVIVNNNFGSSVSATAVNFSTHDVQKVSWSVSGNTLSITCFMVKGSQAKGCVVTLIEEKANLGQYLVIIDHDKSPSQVSGMLTVDKNGSYLMNVYDVEENGDIANSSAWLEMIYVIVPQSGTSSNTRPSSSYDDFPKPTDSLGDVPDESETISTGLLAGLVSGTVCIITIVIVSICSIITLRFRKCRKLNISDHHTEENDYTATLNMISEDTHSSNSSNDIGSEKYMELPFSWTTRNPHVNGFNNPRCATQC